MHPLLLKAGIGATALAAGGGLAVFGSGSPAVAYSSPPLFLSVTVQSPASLVAKGAAVQVPVQLSCSTGGDAYLTITVTERVGRKTASGSHQIEVGCTDSTETVLVTVPSQNGVSFGKGSALAQADLIEFTNYTYGEEQSSATIQIK
jgi:hypothetical protein